MTTICILNKTIEHNPDISNLSKDLLILFRNKYNQTCSKDSGYILNVLKILNIKMCKISMYNGYTITNCDIEVENLLPKNKQILKGVVKQIYPQGIIVLVNNCMKVFVPINKLKDKKNLGEDIVTEIEQIRFQKGKYDCIGKEIIL